MKFVLLFAALFFVIQQEEKKEDPVTEIYQSTLCGGDSMIFGNKTLKFKEVISDSRCPEGVTCVWAGEVRILAELYEGNKKIESFEMVGNTPITWNYGNLEMLKLNVLSVFPTPKLNQKIPFEKYMVNFKITEKIKS